MLYLLPTENEVPTQLLAIEAVNPVPPPVALPMHPMAMLKACSPMLTGPLLTPTQLVAVAADKPVPLPLVPVQLFAATAVKPVPVPALVPTQFKAAP